MRLIFVHGWALEPDIWDALAPRLACFAQMRVDLGFFGAPDLPDLRDGDILVGHSMGLLWGLSQHADWAGIVAINAFARFTLDDAGHGCVKPASLRAMRQALERDPQACANAFRASLGLAPARGRAQKERLMTGLDLLRDGQVAALPEGAALLALGAEDDSLAPPAATRDLAALTGGALALNATGGHGLPWTAPDFCAEQILAFLKAHDA
ncbi:alpha/beta fold hydrolase [Rhodoblastus sp.]|uniref:alpha/beta fold hydrolase n=1 Tax=Rhodoblastus sp. TaxID=1962975 RepID=UPI0035B285EB